MVKVTGFPDNKSCSAGHVQASILSHSTSCHEQGQVCRYQHTCAGCHKCGLSAEQISHFCIGRMTHMQPALISSAIRKLMS